MTLKITILDPAFKEWLLKEKENRLLLWLAAAIMVISFTWLKIIYPFPNFMPPDSYNYIKAAADNDFISIWPIGYSKFLRFVSIFTRSHFVLVVLQYLLLQVSILYFLFTIRYLFSTGTRIFRFLFIASIANPLLPHIANFVSSDCLFTALSVVWLTQLIWILYRPTQPLMLLHAVIVLLAFTVRFNAIYYPFFSIAIIATRSISRNTKWLAIGCIMFLLSLFMGRTVYEYKIKTGSAQYSAFGGWLLAANALYGYSHARQDDVTSVPQKFMELHRIVNSHMDSLKNLTIRPDRELGIYYFWDFKSPLRVYMQQNSQTTVFFRNWASVAPLYASYGLYLIQKHPGHFIKNYIWPNLLQYYAPPTYFMGAYNMEIKNVDPITAGWFDWKNNKLPIRSKDRQIHVFNIFPKLVSIINSLFFLGGILIITFGCFSKHDYLNKSVNVLIIILWICNLLFSIFSAPIELRYQLFPIVFTFPFTILIMSWILRSLNYSSSSKQGAQFKILGQVKTWAK
jgi:hypothetical protein